jgi:exonuclease SbcC
VEPINIAEIQGKIQQFEFEIQENIRKKLEYRGRAKQNEELADELEIELKNIPLDKLQKLKERSLELSEERRKKHSKHKLLNSQIANLEKKLEMLEGHKYDPNCKYCTDNKFVKDAKAALDSLPQLREKEQELAEIVQGLTEKLSIMDISEIEERIQKCDKIQVKIDKSKADAKHLRHKVEKCDLTNERIKSDLIDLRRKESLYEENKETIENLGTLCKEQISLKKMIYKKQVDLDNCNSRLQLLYIDQGSETTILKNLKENQQELEKMERQWTAYDLYMQCMHPNGIPYNIIKQSLPLINEEIAKVLANIVEFETFFDNTDGKLDIYIKHPNYDPRPLSMGSGAEKTIAAMAIRLALISITNLPKSELFILDEPATALDQEHMEGFIRLLDMIKNQFKIVILISHLDSLKDVVDMTIDIQKNGDYAKVRI